MRTTIASVVAAAIALVVLSGCAPTVALQPASHATNKSCAGVIARVPDTVSTLDARETNAQGTAAWGTPATITLRCGVPVPDPTSTLVCVTVDGIDWLLDDSQDPLFVFTTYGRDPATSVTVDSTDKNASANAALTDLSSALGSIQTKHRCVDPSDTLEGGEPVDTPTPTPTP
jgi:hypothetical protein